MVTVGAAIVSSESEVRRLASKIYGVRERSKEAEANQKATVNRAEAEEGSKRSNANRVSSILRKADRRRSGIIAELQGFRRAKENLIGGWRILRYGGTRG